MLSIVAITWANNYLVANISEEQVHMSSLVGRVARHPGNDTRFESQWVQSAYLSKIKLKNTSSEEQENTHAPLTIKKKGGRRTRKPIKL